MQGCLTWAAHAGQPRVVTRMLSQPGIDIDYMDHGSTALFRACWNRDLATVKVFLEAGANLKLLNAWGKSSEPKQPEASSSQFTYLHAVCGLPGGLDSHHDWDDDDSCEMARLLIKHGVDIHHQAEDGSTALHCAVEKSYYLARLLGESGASAQVVDSQGRTPLHRCRVPACVPLLVEEGGADVDAQDVCGNTPLLTALSEHNHDSQILLLLECGADAGVLTSAGESTLHVALKSHYATPVSPLAMFMLQYHSRNG